MLKFVVEVVCSWLFVENSHSAFLAIHSGHQCREFVDFCLTAMQYYSSLAQKLLLLLVTTIEQ